MKKLKSEKGAITIIVLVSVLFFVSFLISSYVIVANKVQAQKEITQQTRSIYENYNIEDVYNSYFGANIIPISTKEQLFAIGTGTDKIINNNYYNFANNEKTIYVLANDIEFNAYEETSLARGSDSYYWVPIGERTDLIAKFEGNGHTITVNYKDDEGDEYSVIYSEKEDYTEPEYKVKITPRILSDDGEIATNAIIYTAIGESNEFVPQEGNGQLEILVKRLRTTNVYVSCEGYIDSGIQLINIVNPNKIQEYKFILGKYSLTIKPTPSNATVTINGVRTNTVSIAVGESVTWEVHAVGYVSTGEQIYTHSVEDNKTIDVALEVAKHTVTINPTPSDSTVIINGAEQREITVEYGTSVNYSVSRDEYYTKEGSVTVYDDMTIDVSLDEWVYIDFSESFYFASCSNSTYSGLLNGGEVSISKYSLGGTDISMGSFYIYEENLITKVHPRAIINKITLSFDCNSNRDNTILYTNKVKSKAYIGSTEVLSEHVTDQITKDVIQIKREITNVSRQELAQGIRVDLTTYIKGTAEVEGTVKNLYCVIEGSYPDI